MANRNGLISSRDVAATGAVASNFFVRKGEPIVSPLVLKSPDGTKTGVVAQNDNGNMVIYSDFAGALYLGYGGVFFGSPTGNVNAQLSVENDGDTAFYQGTGGTLFLGGSTGSIALQNLSTSPLIRVGAANGIVYDTVYNPVASVNASVYTSPSIPVETEVLIGSGTLAEGLYMLQAKVNIDTSSSAYVAGTSINCYVEDLPSLPPTTYAPYSSILITPGALAAPVAPDTNVDATFTSAVFSVPAGKTNWKYSVEVDGSWNFGSGNLTLQLVKIG